MHMPSYTTTLEILFSCVIGIVRLCLVDAGSVHDVDCIYIY